MTKSNNYLGWTNWETWNCFTHLENNETIYKVLKAHTLRAKNEIILAENIKEVVSLWDSHREPKNDRRKAIEEVRGVVR